MGIVYRALDQWNGVPCAVKVLDQTTDSRRFLREARILAQLKHPAIVRYVGHGLSPEGRLFLAMEWVEGTDLEQRITERPLSVRETLEVGRRLAEALSVVHEASIVHRDLKPSNVFLEQGKVELAKLGDFGVAHLSGTRGPGSTLTQTGTIVGTPGYLAPEQLRGGRVDPRTDLFGLGCILFECLTGRAAFEAETLLALLAKIALDPTPRVRDAIADVPGELDALVCALLEKEVSARPASAADVLSALANLHASSATARVASDVPTIVGTAERRLVPLVFSPAPDSAGESVPDRVELHEIATRAGARLELLPDGSIIAMFTGVVEAPTELTLRAARLALALRQVLGSRPIAVVTARVVVSAGFAVSDVISQALPQVLAAPPGAIVLDEGSAALLDARFHVARDGSAILLGAEKTDEYTARRLLGRATPFVGRRREFSLLFATLEECIEESYARAMLVSGVPGVGKSRLLAELLAEAKKHHGKGLRTVVARGDPELAGQPYSLLGTALRRFAGIRAEDGHGERLAKLRALFPNPGPAAGAANAGVFLGEIMGLELPDSIDPRLRAARRDPPMMSVLTRDAFVTWARNAAGKGGLLLALDDLHWADALSVQLVDAALGALKDVPLFVLALGRPEVREAYPRLFETRDFAELALGRLSRRASEELVAAILGGDAPEALVTAIVDRAEGNAFFLEELIRAGAAGDVSRLPDTMLGVMESRLGDLETEARLVLRAASVFGEGCWTGAVTNVLGPESAIADVAGWLRALAAREILIDHPISRFGAEPEYGFRHALLRDACYATFADSDRRLSHRRAAEWLEAKNEAAAVVLASHWERAGDVLRAVASYLRAMEQSLRGSDLESVIALAERAERGGAEGELLGKVRLLESEAFTWMGAGEQALDAAIQSVELLPRESVSWHGAIATAVEAAMVLGRPEAAEPLVRELASVPAPAAPGGEEDRAAALARASCALILLGRGEEATDLLAEADRIARTGRVSDPMTLAHLAHARAARAMVERKPEMAAQFYAGAGEAFERSGAPRLASGAHANVAAMYIEMGASELALSALERAIELAERAGAAYTLTLARLNRGIALSRLGSADVAARELREVSEELTRRGDRRLVSSAACALAELLLETAHPEEALAEAKRAVAAAEGLTASHAAALATLALVRLRLGDAAGARELAEQADAERRKTTMEEREVLLDLVLSEATYACGDRRDAEARIASVAAALEDRAREIVSDELRRAFLERVPEHQRVRKLSREWQGVQSSRR
jgi:eukaryotic-like serine/threonine-protein kinase